MATKENKKTVTVEIPTTLHDAVVQMCNITSTPEEYITQAVLEKLKYDIVKYNAAIGFTQRNLDIYEGIDKTK